MLGLLGVEERGRWWDAMPIVVRSAYGEAAELISPSMLSSADREWRDLAGKLLRGYIPRHSTPYVLVELARLNRRALRQENYYRRLFKQQAEQAELEPTQDAYHWSPNE